VSTGTSEAFEVLGVVLDGGTVTIQYEETGILTDAGGKVPTEIQQMGSLAYIDFELPVKDLAVLDKIRRRSEGSATVGQGGVPGVLLGTGSHLFKLYLPSTTASPWVFNWCKLETDAGKHGTEHTKDRLRFKAIRYIAGTATTTSGVALYTRVAPA
jgi:hypothetical protein